MFRKLLTVGLAFLTAACAPNPCDSSAAVAPGRTVTNDVSNALPAHIDITEVSTTLAGETLNRRLSSQRRTRDFDVRQNRCGRQ